MDTLTVVGWGVTDLGDFSSFPDLFQEVEIAYMSNNKCKNTTDKYGQSYGEWITEDHLCAGQEGKDSCYGDSGSPLIKRGVTNVKDVQVGIVSWGVDCAGPLPGVYSRLSFMYDWLRETICDYSDKVPQNIECTPQQLPSESGTKDVTGTLISGDNGGEGADAEGESEMQQGKPWNSASPARFIISFVRVLYFYLFSIALKIIREQIVVKASFISTTPKACYMRAGFFFFEFPEPSTLRFLFGSLLSLFTGSQNLPPNIHRDFTNKSFAIVPLCLTRLPQNGFTLKKVSLESLSASVTSASRMLASPEGMSLMKARSRRY